MADYKIVDADELDNGFSIVADSIRAKSGSTEKMAFPEGYKEQVDSIYWSNQQVYDFFQNRKTIIDLKIPPGITQIPAYCFYRAEDLIITELPDTIETIEESAFMYCDRLSLTKLPQSLRIIGASAFRGASVHISELPSNLESIDNYAFLNRAHVTFSSIPKSVTTIGQRVFEGCTGLTSITFRGTPTSIGTGVFNSCTNLLVINVPWAEGEVANAPWGAANATINYNYVESEG